ncbi:hypothetical protein KA005_71080 [bacterium]|nr:hypothetical protein [bacterium]
MKNMEDLGKSQFSAAGFCIYCGKKKDLRREHIIPFGLSGTAVIPKASCSSCADITKKFEEDVLRGPMWAVRVYRRMKSRRKHSEAPKLYSITVVKDGKEQNIKLPIEKYPILLHFPVFAPPSYFANSNCKTEINVTGRVTVSFGPRPEKVLAEIGAQNLKISQNLMHVPFAKMIAKIAYCMAYAVGALELIEGESVILPSILGTQKNIGKWVGTITEPINKYDNHLHRVFIHKDDSHGLLFGEVHLFADSQSPSYGVILGKLK